MSGETRPSILHISGDFPDPIATSKTPVIQRLIALTRGQFDHHIVSINRRSPSGMEWMKGAPLLASAASIIQRRERFDGGIAVEYTAPPKGILHKASLDHLGEWIAQYARAELRPDLIIGHKLTIEGIAARYTAETLGVPFAISLQGNTDCKILRARPDLRREFGRIFHSAEMVFPFAPWAYEEAVRILGRREKPTLTLPCATDLDMALPPQPGGTGLVSLFHLAGYKNKNLAGLTRAMQMLENRPEIPALEIMGGGTPADIDACTKLTCNAPNIRLAGPPERQQIATIFNKKAGFVMPSLSESFGLVFIEALFAGLPIIYPKGRAVDGFFNDMPFAIAADPRSPKDIARATMHLCENEADLKASLAGWQASDHAHQFTQGAIAQTFSAGLNAALKP